MLKNKSSMKDIKDYLNSDIIKKEKDPEPKSLDVEMYDDEGKVIVEENPEDTQMMK